MTKTGFVPIAMEAYVEKHLRANPGSSREEIAAGLRTALKAYKAGTKCACGNRIWVLGSALVGNSCFTCSTGEASPTDDYEIDEACDKE